MEGATEQTKAVARSLVRDAQLRVQAEREKREARTPKSTREGVKQGLRCVAKGLVLSAGEVLGPLDAAANASRGNRGRSFAAASVVGTLVAAPVVGVYEGVQKVVAGSRGSARARAVALARKGTSAGSLPDVSSDADRLAAASADLQALSLERETLYGECGSEGEIEVTGEPGEPGESAESAESGLDWYQPPPELLFSCLFSPNRFRPLIGDVARAAILATALSESDVSVEEQANFNERRVVELALNLNRRIAPFVEGRKEEFSSFAIRELCISQRSRSAATFFTRLARPTSPSPRNSSGGLESWPGRGARTEKLRCKKPDSGSVLMPRQRLPKWDMKNG